MDEPTQAKTLQTTTYSYFHDMNVDVFLLQSNDGSRISWSNHYLTERSSKESRESEEIKSMDGFYFYLSRFWRCNIHFNPTAAELNFFLTKRTLTSGTSGVRLQVKVLIAGLFFHYHFERGVVLKFLRDGGMKWEEDKKTKKKEWRGGGVMSVMQVARRGQMAAAAAALCLAD